MVDQRPRNDVPGRAAPHAGAEVGLALVRHGRSAHPSRGWIDGGGFRAWRTAYEAAGLHGGEAAPPHMLQLADRATLVVASDAPRAVESGRLLAPSREVTVSPLLRELDLEAPRLGGLRLPLIGWALAVGARTLLLRVSSRYPSPRELARVAAAADWLSGLAGRHALVVAVTHASFRRQLALHLVRAGWRLRTSRRPLHHWSAWLLAPPDRQSP